MKKTLLATMLLLGTSIPLQNKSLPTKIVGTPISEYKKTIETFLETEQKAYHPSMQEFLDLKKTNYTIKKISESNPTEIPSAPKYLPEKELDQLINNIYNKERIPKIISKDLFRTIIKKESHDGYGYNIYAHNKKSGARGLGQIMPKTWKEMDPHSNFYIEAINPQKNLKNSLKYLKWISKALKKMNPEWQTLSKEKQLEQIIASYNWGIGKLKRNDWDFAQAPKETQNYKKFVRKHSKIFKK